MSGSVYSSGAYDIFFFSIRERDLKKYQILSILYLPMFLMNLARN